MRLRVLGVGIILFCANFLVNGIAMGQAETTAAKAAEQGWPHVKYAIYFTSSEVQKLLGTPEARADTLAYFAPIRARKFYLEYSGNDTDVPGLKQIRDALRAQGIESAGAVVPNYRGPLCYNNPEHMDLLEKRVRSLADVFDQLIVDDWLFTICTCEKCVEGRGSQSWADYRRKLVAERSAERILAPARQVNPKIKVVVKYPNWYEGHPSNGYDVERQTKQFDMISVGIETRQRVTHDQHIPIYSGYVFQKWYSGIDPAKWSSAWLDNYAMKGADNDYVAQVWQAVLAQAPEIIFWSGGQLHPTGPSSDVYPHLRDLLPEFDRLAALLKTSARGVPVHLPFGSTGEYNIFGYLGMAGIPVAPQGTFPDADDIAIFTRHSLKDPALADKMLAQVRGGKDVFLTWDLLRLLGNTELAQVLQLVDSEGSVSSRQFRTRGLGWRPEIVESDQPITFPRISTTTWPDAREVAAVREDYDFGVLLRAPYLKGNVYVLNMPENSYDLLRLPTTVLNSIRRPFFRQLGAQLLGPGGIGFYPFGDKQYVLYNMNDAPVDAGIRVMTTSTDGWREVFHGKQVAATEVRLPRRPGPAPADNSRILDVMLTLRPFEVAVIQAP